VNDRSDQQLLQDYAHNRSDSAFAELVRRHLDLVYSAALRRLGDAHLAEDVAQGTFTALAQNAHGLAEHPVLSGWLHRTTQNLAANLIRTNLRRQTREQEAVTMNQLLSSAPDDANWQSIAPHLDAALDELESPDRDVVMLRYFEKKSAREAAVQLGISEDAAQKRVSRAVDRLREFFAKRGVTVGASGLAVVISANAVQAAPVGLALTISTAAALTGTTLATSATITATKAIAMTTLQKVTITATIAALAGVGIYEARQVSQLRDEVQTVKRLTTPLEMQLQLLTTERDQATNLLSAMLAENTRLKSGSRDLELLKLRGEIGLLRRRVLELSLQSQTASLATNQPPPTYSTEPILREAWGFAGYQTPAAAVQTLIWAKSTGDFQTFLNSIVPEEKDAVINGYHAGQSPEQAASKLQTETKQVQGLQILREIPIDADTVIVQTLFQLQSTTGEPLQETLQMVFKRGNGEWKYYNEYVPKH
jgi:RNA polymerase sigma factor (sigma-70 family)